MVRIDRHADHSSALGVGRRGRARDLVAGIGFFASYALTLAALRIASPAPVAAVRETSVVIAAAVLAVSGRERLGRGRMIGSACVVAGIASIAFG